MLLLACWLGFLEGCSLCYALFQIHSWVQIRGFLWLLNLNQIWKWLLKGCPFACVKPWKQRTAETLHRNPSFFMQNYFWKDNFHRKSPTPELPFLSPWTSQPAEQQLVSSVSSSVWGKRSSVWKAESKLSVCFEGGVSKYSWWWTRRIFWINWSCVHFSRSLKKKKKQKSNVLCKIHVKR